MRIPEEVINQVRTSINITDVVSPYVDLQKQGRNLFGKCPFHEEKTPSFSVNEEKQIFHCFSCGRGGNAFKFLMDLKGLSFPEAVIEITDQANVPLDKQYMQQTSAPVDAETQQQMKLHEDAAKLYHHLLVNTHMGDEAVDYLRDKRHLADDMLEQFDVGYAAPQQSLLKYFTDKSITTDDLRASNLFIETDEGQLRDRFVGRVIFPIRDENGHAVGFSGRSLDAENKIKYMNSPESKLFNKSKLLFNLDLAKQTIRRDKQVIIFEGFMDVIAAYGAGVKNGVASMGTSLTREQVQILNRLANEIVIAYDGDSAGQAATWRAINLINDHSDLNIGVVVLPDGQDPDEYLRARGPERLAFILQRNHLTQVEFAMQYLQVDRNLENEGDLVEYLEEVLTFIAKVDTPVERDLHLNHLAQEFGIDKASLQTQFDQIKLQATSAKRSPTPESSTTPVIEKVVATTSQLSRVEKAEQALLLSMLHYDSVWSKVASIKNFQFSHLQYQTLFYLGAGYKAAHQEQPFSLAEFLDTIQDDQLSRLLVAVESNGGTVTDNEQAIEDYIQVIMVDSPHEQAIKDLQAKIKDAQSKQDDEVLNRLTNELLAMRKKYAQQGD